MLRMHLIQHRAPRDVGLCVRFGYTVDHGEHGQLHDELRSSWFGYDIWIYHACKRSLQACINMCGAHVDGVTMRSMVTLVG